MRNLKITKRQALIIIFKMDVFTSLFGGVPRKADQIVIVETEGN